MVNEGLLRIRTKNSSNSVLEVNKSPSGLPPHSVFGNHGDAGQQPYQSFEFTYVPGQDCYTISNQATPTVLELISTPTGFTVIAATPANDKRSQQWELVVTEKVEDSDFYVIQNVQFGTVLDVDAPAGRNITGQQRQRTDNQRWELVSIRPPGPPDDEQDTSDDDKDAKIQQLKDKVVDLEKKDAEIQKLKDKVVDLEKKDAEIQKLKDKVVDLEKKDTEIQKLKDKVVDLEKKVDEKTKEIGQKDAKIAILTARSNEPTANATVDGNDAAGWKSLYTAAERDRVQWKAKSDLFSKLVQALERHSSLKVINEGTTSQSLYYVRRVGSGELVGSGRLGSFNETARSTHS